MSLENFGNFLTLDEKHSFIKKYFKEFYTKDFKLFASKDKHYRTRAELSFYHENDTLFYAMFDPKSKKKYIIEYLDFADEKICAFMPRLLEYLRQDNKLKEKLFGVEFLTTKQELS
ncbi:tRNA (uridine(54)-C5)-methyltransferase TrmA, partial [Campylobacter jejuni]|nr:tRNA (uridine(54)-C5)-methyltransferase TrmA [Campylobacter jejuni]EAI0198547.1 tRNA (uridine(54)-C5)-methyltransferase TrmA [Campylobacter jejuni]EAI4135197.1 tRNA (uridine(54)-C5)-methyltransferase TrmA [Campylobacter jejuni]EAI5651373.1 tRNA (uridine(54)-C5)-methyltransferase TrmA [Campylobacter jejuni]EAI8069580.1 tRNA (uridine(54)-C5)-methyltransferase TrmA [Campylobacter jejuni]